ncbi:sensor histidine kinase [Cryptosporangium sp. NPDC051539]|uniref:sensor histidine kinase n=1 Tax=Cryptosporangium sp. NPDC051539 TaxID=3363962 RepID=UPI0037A7EDC6
MTAVAVLLSLAYIFAYGDHAFGGGPDMVLPMAVVLGWPLVVLRGRPVLATALILLAAALLLPTMNVVIVGPIAVAATLAAVWLLATSRPWRVSLPASALATAVLLALTTAFYLGRRNFVTTAAILVLAAITVWTVAGSFRQRRRFADARRAQEIERADARRAEETERAVVAERLRIARELHDLIAHSLGAIAIQAGVGRRVIDNRPAEARNALDAIESTSRQALAELRRTLTALRRSDPEAPAGSEFSPSPPAPGLADLERVLAVARDSGVQVDVEQAGAVRDLPADLDLAAFRIVQEAVTNVVRHAGTDRCTVRLTYGDSLEIDVTDDGAGSGTPGTGYGLVGMRERVTLLDGRFEAGPRPEGGFRVSALVPLP